MRSDSGIFPSNQATCVGGAVATKRRAQSRGISAAVASWAPFPSPFLGEADHRLHLSRLTGEGLSFPASLMIGPPNPDELPY